MSWTLCTSGAAIARAGANANADIIASGSILQEWSDEVEGMIVTRTRRDWVDSYSDVDSNLKNVLKNISSAGIAMNIVAYDPSGYSSMREAETILDLLRDSMEANFNVLEEFNSTAIKGVG